MPGDFRYNTGSTAVPWPAVGESYDARDAVEVVRFLLHPGGDRRAYARAFTRARAALLDLGRAATPATKLTTGGEVAKLEKAAAKLLGVTHALFCSSWTAGAEIACYFAGIRPGDEVIIPAITFFATATHPLSLGARIVLADVDPRTLNMDPEDVLRKITAKTKAIIPVHLGGYPAEMAPIMKMARARGITVIEDAAHAFGASYRGKMIGTIGDFGAYSFHEVKNITSFGEGGILVTNLPCGADLPKARFIGFDGSRRIENWLYDVVALEGKNGYFPGRMCPGTEIQALGLRLQMAKLRRIIAQRRRAAEYLTKRFAGVAGLVPQMLDAGGVKSTYHLYLLQIDSQEAGGDVQELKEELSKRGVTQIPHFAPLYKFSALRQLGYDTRKLEESCPVAEEAFRHRFTHLPLYGLSAAQVRYMADAVVASFEAIRSRAGRRGAARLRRRSA